MGAMPELDIVLQTLRGLGHRELADLGRQVDLVFPSGPESPGAHFLASLRDALADMIEGDGFAPDPDADFEIPAKWDVIPDGRNAWDAFLDLEAFRTDHARRQHLTTDGVRIVLDRVGTDFWRELVSRQVPARFYL